MSSTPKLSVLMPAFNVGTYIAESIESILEQTFKDFELLILDDGSTDNSWEIISSYASKDQRIVALRNDKNLGISNSRNILIERASASIIAWQDADDIACKDRLLDQYSFLELHPEVGMCGGYLEFFDEKGVQGIRKYAAEDQELRTKMFRYSPVAQPVAMIRKECFVGIAGYDPKWPGAEDLHMSFKIGCKWKFANIQKVLVRYRVHQESVTFKKLRALEKNTLSLRRRFASNPAYHFTVTDFVYNATQWVTMYIMPSRLRIAVFSWFRNSKKS